MDFRRSPPGSITNNFGVDPNYRLGYVQIWNVDVQQQILPTLIMNLDYTGTKGTRLDILEAPNRTATGVLFPGVQPFYWEDSVGDSTANAGSVRVRKRLQAGFSIGGRYTFSKSLDNASTIGSGEPLVAQGAGRTGLSGTTNVAQNAFDLAGRARLVQLRSASPVSRLTICGSFPSAMTGDGSRETARCEPSLETGTGAATGPSLRDCPSLPEFLATRRM